MNHVGTAIVTGGASGIGRAFCLELARRGWLVVVADIDRTAAESVAAEIDGIGGLGVAAELDVSDAASWAGLQQQVAPTCDEVDLLVNSAGVLVTGTVAETAADDLQRIVDINLLGTMLGCRTVVPWLAAGSKDAASNLAPRGVINIASIFAAIAPPGFAAYNATKAGVVALSESLYGELAPLGLGVTVVLPGVTPTNLFTSARYGQASHVELCKQFVAASKITPEAVASQALQAAARGQLYVVVGRRAKWYWRLKRLAPQWLMHNIGRRAARELGLGRGDSNRPSS